MIFVAPDTSPRGEDVPDDPDGAWDFGLGAGFYLDAIQAPWSEHYRMESYVTRDLQKAVPALILEKHLFGVDIDLRATQISALALWLRAQRAFDDLGLKAAERPPVTRANIASIDLRALSLNSPWT